jgi:V-type H+-transporting ATPase subunit a
VGMLNRDKVATFELMLWRLCRGNALLKTADLEELIEDPQTVKFDYIF